MVLDALILHSKLFLSSDMEIDIEDVNIHTIDHDKLELKEYTSMIGTGGTLNMMVIISYETALLEYLVDIFLEGEEVDDDEMQEVLDSTSGEIINTIIGLALPSFPKRGKGITITPPIAINDASNIKKYKNSQIVSADIITEHGTMSVSAISADDVIKG